MLILFRDQLGLLMPLEPGQVLFVEPPGLLLELLRRKVPLSKTGDVSWMFISLSLENLLYNLLLVSALLVVKDKEERIHIELFKQSRVIEDRKLLLWIEAWGRVRVARLIHLGSNDSSIHK